MNGTVFLAGDVERGVKPVYEIFIFVTDTVFTNYTTIVITITEFNEFNPTFSTNDAESIAFAEDLSLLSIIASFNVTDADFGLSGVFDISVTNSAAFFGISQSSGYKFVSVDVDLIQEFDFEVLHTYLYFQFL